MVSPQKTVDSGSISGVGPPGQHAVLTNGGDCPQVNELMTAPADRHIWCMTKREGYEIRLPQFGVTIGWRHPNQRCQRLCQFRLRIEAPRCVKHTDLRDEHRIEMIFPADAMPRAASEHIDPRGKRPDTAGGDYVI